MLATLITSCASTKEFPSNYKGDQIHFGQGGGFTGIITHYALLDDGRVFEKIARDTAYTFFEKWDKSFVQQLFANYAALELNKLDHYHPGNLYYFIEYHSQQSPVHRISWGQSGHPVDDEISQFYNLLYQSTKSKS